MASESTAESRRAEPAPAGGKLHRRIRSELEERIVSGVWPPGHRIPIEHELMRAYGCSRMTISKVLTGLSASGLIERRRRAGSFVARPTSQSAVLKIQDVRADVLALGLAYRLAIIFRRKRKSTRADMQRLRIDAARPVLALSCQHFAGPRVYALEDRIIDLTAVPDAASEDFRETPPGTWLLRHVPWTDAEHRISAINADRLVAKALDVPIGTACLVIERQTWRAARPVTSVRMIFPGDTYQLIARFAQAQA